MGELHTRAAVTNSIDVFVRRSQLVINFDALIFSEFDSCFFKSNTINIRFPTSTKKDRFNLDFLLLTRSYVLQGH
jgi:hypothetical protein